MDMRKYNYPTGQAGFLALDGVEKSPAEKLATIVSALHTQFVVRLHWVFLAIIAPLVVGFSLMTPPLQAPDEWAHYYRSMSVSYGELIGTKPPHGEMAGAYLPQSSLIFEDFFQSRLQDATALARDTRAPLLSLGWDERVFTPFRLIVYPPITYAPSAIGLWLGRSFGADIVSSYYLGRIFAALAYVLLAVLAIRWAPIGKVFVFAILSLPMSLFLAGSYSHDGLLIAFSALAVAGFGNWFNALQNKGAVSRFKGDYARFVEKLPLVICVSTTALLVTERPPYTPLLLIGMMIAQTVIQGRENIRKKWRWLLGAPLAAMLLWAIATHGFVTIGDYGVRPEKTILLLLTHLSQVPTRIRDLDTTIKGIVGVFGQIALPAYCYILYGIILGLALLHDAFFSTNGMHIVSRAATFVAVLGAVFGMFLWAYLCWDSIGSPEIYGVQGRYLIIPIMFLGLVCGKQRNPTDDGGNRNGAAATLLLACCAGIFIVDVGAIVSTVTFYLFQ